MILDELISNLSDESLDINFDVVSTQSFPKVYSKLLPDFNFNFLISKAIYTSECLELMIDTDKYYLLESNVLYTKKVSVSTYKQKSLLFRKKQIYTTDEDEVIELCETAKKSINKTNKSLFVDYKREYNAATDSLVYYFILRTYFICKNEKLEETTLQEFKKIKHTYKKRILKMKQDVLDIKLLKFFEKLL